jgi:DNA-binding GntR family transcriptional regulator
MDAEPANTFSRMHQPSLAERVTTDLREAILGGRMRPGDKISDARIAEAMGVSRAPVREAIRHLAAQGLVREEPRRGAFVTSLSRTGVHDIYECRRALEVFAAQWLSVNAKREASRELNGIIRGMDQVASIGDREGLAQVDQRFHGHLIGLTGNVWLARLYSVISDQMLMILSVNTAAHPLDDIHEMTAIHVPIVKAIAAGDPKRAATAVLNHLEIAERQFVAEAGHLFDED